MEQLPGYAPDLNPDEGVWNYLKRVELANMCCRDLHAVRRQLIRAHERQRHKRDLLRACSRGRLLGLVLHDEVSKVCATGGKLRRSLVTWRPGCGDPSIIPVAPIRELVRHRKALVYQQARRG
ncbi:MAG TPA: hypothetical protein VGP82_18050 [Ktedonobacterales bacterium]|nr:hypothetical protein [Ktedonobacterales bacterium]